MNDEMKCTYQGPRASKTSINFKLVNSSLSLYLSLSLNLEIVSSVKPDIERQSSMINVGKNVHALEFKRNLKEEIKASLARLDKGN